MIIKLFLQFLQTKTRFSPKSWMVALKGVLQCGVSKLEVFKSAHYSVHFNPQFPLRCFTMNSAMLLLPPFICCPFYCDVRGFLQQLQSKDAILWYTAAWYCSWKMPGFKPLVWISPQNYMSIHTTDSCWAFSDGCKKGPKNAKFEWALTRDYPRTI